MSDKIRFECHICGNVFDRRQDAKRHISKSADAKHAEKSGSDPGVIHEVVDEDSIVADNSREEYEGEERTELSSGNASYKGPARGIDATMTPISERSHQQTVTELEANERVLIALSDEQVAKVLASEELDASVREEIVRQLIAISSNGD